MNGHYSNGRANDNHWKWFVYTHLVKSGSNCDPNWCNATTEHIRARSMFALGESLLYPVYGMRGGFSLDLDHEVGWMMAQVTLLGWIFRTTVSLWWAGAGERENMVER